MVTAVTRPPSDAAQRAASRVSARLSEPPETATASSGVFSKGPRTRISRMKRKAPSGLTAGWAPEPSRTGPFERETKRASRAAVMFLLAPRADQQILGRAGIFAHQLRQRRAGILLLSHLAQRHAELEQVVGGLAAVGIFLEALGEGDGGLLVVAAHIVGLAQPILGVAREHIVRVLLHEGGEGLLGLGIVGRAQQPEGVFILLLRRGAGQLIE